MIYVMSDIHGNMPNFMSIMRQINLQPEDTLYILGDVIDRHPDGLKIIRMIMQMPNVKMLLGNHEYMMLDALNETRPAPEGPWEREAARRRMRIWYHNGGDVTHNYYKHIRKAYRAEIIDYLNSLPTNIDVEVNGKKYKLVHGSPIENYNTRSYKYTSEKEFAVWERWEEGHPIPEGYTLIFGHTPTYHLQDNDPLEIWYGNNVIGIDCGSGFPPKEYYFVEGRLACLRLDDMKEFYSEEETFLRKGEKK